MIWQVSMRDFRERYVRYCELNDFRAEEDGVGLSRRLIGEFGVPAC